MSTTAPRPRGSYRVRLLRSKEPFSDSLPPRVSESYVLTFNEPDALGYDWGVTTHATVAKEVDRYLRTGETDPYHAAWTGSLLERSRRAREDLRDGLVHEVRRRARGRSHRPVPDGNTIALTRRKVEPMVRGLFSRIEQETVLRALEASVVFLTADTIESVLTEQRHEHTAWHLANLYLLSLGAELLGPGARQILGLSQETTCYVSVEYFGEVDPFDDFVIHEVAHIFHNCKRVTVGLAETRKREWLLDIDFGKRETFAYACEVYARILERAGSPAERRLLADEYAATARKYDGDVDDGEVASIVRDAVSVRNGWKVILARCAPRKRDGRSEGRL